MELGANLARIARQNLARLPHVTVDENRRALLDCVGRMIDEEYGGRITKAYLTDLFVAPRL